MTHYPTVVTHLLGAALLSLTFTAGDAAAQGRASVSASAGRPNAVFLELPRNPDPCGAFLNNMPQRYRNLTLQFGPVDLDTRTLFLLKCNEKKDELIATITGPIEELRAKAEGAVQTEIDRVRNDLTGGFWAFAAEMMRDQLPESERQKYAPGSDEALALAHDWLNDPSAELALYVDVYFSQPGNGSRLYDAYKAYIDVTNGESKAILESLNGVLDRAKARLSQVLGASSAAEAAPPDTPTADILEKAGLSGEWIDNFRSYEGQIRDFDKSWKVQEALGIMQGAFATDVPHDKVRAFFNLMDTMSSLASDSNIPLVSLVGDIIGSYAQIANQTLDAVLALGEKIKQRHGFCLGLGVATDDPRSGYFSDRAVLACPMAISTWPFRHVYEAQEKESGRLYFWDGSTFIAGEDGGGRPGVLAALRLIQAAGDLGYRVEADPPDHVGLVGRVYNSSYPGGIPGLVDEAERIVTSIDGASRRFVRTLSLADACTEDQVLQTVGDRADFSLSNFADELRQNGTSRLTAAIAASFLALEGLIGTGNRTEAFQTYVEAEDRLSDLSFLILEGTVLDQDRAPVADAELEVRIGAGEEVRGCETWRADADGRFTVYALGAVPRLAIDVRASADGADSRSETFDIAHFRATSRRIVEHDGALFARAPGEIILRIEAEDDPSQPPAPEGDETGEDGETPPGDDPDTAALCAAAAQRLDEAVTLAGDGQFSAARDLLEVLKSSPCETVAAQAVELDAEITRIVADAVAKARAAAGQCDVAALQDAAESLEALDDPAARSAQAEILARIPALSSAMERFETARADYKGGDLAAARNGLTEARELFQNVGGVDCSTYLDRIETGFDRITRLETALSRADQAMVSCNADTIAAFERRFADRAAEHVLIAGKAAELAQVLGNLSRVTSLIGPVLDAQAAGNTDYAATLIADARALLDGPLGGLNCDTLRAKLEIAEARQPARDGAEADDDAVADNQCTAMQAMEERAKTAYFEGRFDAAREILATMRRIMPDAAQLEGCEILPENTTAWMGTVDIAIDLAGRTAIAVDACRLSDFDGLETEWVRHPPAAAERPLAMLRRARDTCGAASAEADETENPAPPAENEEQMAEASPPAAPAAAGLDGNWTGTGEFPIAAAGQRMVLDMGIELALSNGRSSGDVTFFNEGKSMARFAISGTFDGRGISHQNRWTYEGFGIANAFNGTFSSEGSIDGDGYLALPELNCLAEAIGEMAGSAAAGALGAFSDDDDGGDTPCPIKQYPLRWSAQKR